MTQAENVKNKLLLKDIKNEFLNGGISHLSLFGSFARNEATKDSDLDLLIELDGSNTTTIGTLQHLEDILKKEFKVKKVDFVSKRKVNLYLKNEIEKDLIKIY